MREERCLLLGRESDPWVFHSDHGAVTGEGDQSREPDASVGSLAGLIRNGHLVPAGEFTDNPEPFFTVFRSGKEFAELMLAVLTTFQLTLSALSDFGLTCSFSHRILQPILFAVES